MKPLRLWPGVVIVTVQLLIRFALPVVEPEAQIFALLGGFAGGVALVVWWMFFSRAPWSERVGAIILMIVALFVTSRLLHESIATGAMGMLFVFLAVPGLSLAFVAWAVATRHLSSVRRRAAMVVTILLACGVWTLVRTAGFTGNFTNDLEWRWSKTPEERLLAQGGDEPLDAARDRPLDATRDKPIDVAGDKPVDAARTATPQAVGGTAATGAAGSGATATAPAGIAGPTSVADRSAASDPESNGVEWPGFRGRERDGVIRGVRIETDWSAKPPVKLWRRPIGPGWSSFAVRGNLLYTQEQRGAEEVVSSYNVTTGAPVWRHRDIARFWESNGGPGPRATPTVSNGRVYTLGATGIVNALDARDGAVVWSRNAATDTGATVPMWGFAGSPLVVGDLVIIAASGALVAYDIATGKPRWHRPVGREGYTSPHLATIDGVPQILLVTGSGVTSVAPADGTRLWEHEWRGYPIVQPAQTADGDVLIAVTESTGTRRLAAARGAGGWTVQERWTSMGLKPYFNDFVVHKGHVFGFDGRILACIDLKDGARKWKGGRYGSGQLVLLADQDVLLVISEEGELALVGATTDQFRELARFPAIEGKTWNHPVLAGDVLLVRNDQEMAAFRLSLAGR